MTINLSFVGHVYDEEHNHDKVWVSFYDTDSSSYYCAWGRRGAKLQFKRFTRLGECTMVETKKRKTYQEIDNFLLFTLFPDFEDRVKDELFLNTLAGKIR